MRRLFGRSFPGRSFPLFLILWLCCLGSNLPLSAQSACGAQTRQIVDCVVEGAAAQLVKDPLSTSCTGADVCRRIREGRYLEWARSAAGCGHISSVPTDAKSAVLTAFGCAVDTASSASGPDSDPTPGAIYATLCHASAYGQNAIKKMLGATSCYVGDAAFRAATGNLSRNVFKEYPNFFDIPIQEHVSCVDSNNALAGKLESDGSCRWNLVAATKKTFLTIAETDGADLVLSPGPAVRNAGHCSAVDRADIADWRVRADLCQSLTELQPVSQTFDTARYVPCKWYVETIDFRWVSAPNEVASDNEVLGSPSSIAVGGSCRSAPPSQSHVLVDGFVTDPLWMFEIGQHGGPRVAFPTVVDRAAGKGSANRLSRTLELNKRIKRLTKLCQLQKRYYPELTRCIEGDLAEYTVKANHSPSQFQIEGWREGQKVETDLIGSRVSQLGEWRVPPQFASRRGPSGSEYDMAGIDVGDVAGLKMGPLLDWGVRVVPPCKVTIEVNRLFVGGIYRVPENGIPGHRLRMPVHSGPSTELSPPLTQVLWFKGIVGGGSGRYYSYIAASRPPAGSPPCS